MAYPVRFYVLTATVLVALLGVGIAHGFWTNRWASDQLSDEQMAEMEQLGLRIGGWEGRTIPREQVREALADTTECMQRRYVNPLDGSSCAVLLTRGRPGPMVIKHLPTECYPSSGFAIVGEPKRFLTNNKIPDEFWVATFKKTTEAFPLTVQVYWSWSGDGQWRVPEQPRLAFAKFHSIYKMYVVQTLVNENEPMERAPIHEFIAALTNDARTTIFQQKSQDNTAQSKTVSK
jgi:Protein of unknown function (DUF3485)